MNRDNLIQRLVRRKLKTAKNDKPRFCVCMARVLYMVGGQQHSGATTKK